MSQPRSARRRIERAIGILIGSLIALFGFVLVIGHFALDSNRDRWLEALIEFVGIFAIGLVIVVGTVRETRAMRLLNAANVTFWFALYNIVYSLRDYTNGKVPSTRANVSTAVMIVLTIVFGVMAYRARTRRVDSGSAG
jgi:peptidoglycan/LPS O-acetylase OafA/YrhL